MYFNVNESAPGLGALHGKRVKRYLANLAAQTAAATAAAASPAATAAQVADAARLQAQQAAELQSFAAKERTKKHGLMRLRSKIDPVARHIEFMKTAKKEGFKAALKGQTKELKELHLKATGAMAKISPSFKKHYEFEAGKIEAKGLSTRLQQVRALRAAGDTPMLAAEETQIMARLAEIGRKQKKYIKQGKIAATIAAIVGTIFTFGAGAPIFQGGMQAIKAGAMELGKALLKKAIPMLIAKGLSKHDAHRAVDALAAFPPDPSLTDPTAMVADSLAKQDAAHSGELPPGQVVEPEQARAEFMTWLRDWNPQVYTAAQQSAPSLSGLGDVWGDLWGSVKDAGQAYLQTALQKKMLELQAKRAAANQTPAPTAALEQAARARISDNTMLYVGLGGVGVLGLVLLMRE